MDCGTEFVGLKRQWRCRSGYEESTNLGCLVQSPSHEAIPSRCCWFCLTFLVVVLIILFIILSATDTVIASEAGDIGCRALIGLRSDAT